MVETNPQEVQKGRFADAIKLCDEQIKRLKNKPERAQKYQDAKKELVEAQKKLDDIISQTKNIKLVFYHTIVVFLHCKGNTKRGRVSGKIIQCDVSCFATVVSF